MKSFSLTIAIPAYNEEGSVQRVALQALRAAKALTDKYEILLVNDGSSDRTGTIIDTLTKKHKEIRVIHHRKNQGFSGAIKTCYRNAKNDLVFLAPADGQVDIGDCKLFIEKMNSKTALVEGDAGRHGISSTVTSSLGLNRWIMQPLELTGAEHGMPTKASRPISDKNNMDPRRSLPRTSFRGRDDASVDVVVGYRINNPEPLSRKVNSFLFHLLYRILFGVKLREISTSILWRKKVLDSIEITSSARSAMIEPEVVYRAWKQGYRFAQVGIPYYPRTHGKANGGNPLMIFVTLKEMLRLWITLRFLEW